MTNPLTLNQTGAMTAHEYEIARAAANVVLRSLLRCGINQAAVQDANGFFDHAVLLCSAKDSDSALESLMADMSEDERAAIAEYKRGRP